jgi:hypothetical protein
MTRALSPGTSEAISLALLIIQLSIEIRHRGLVALRIEVGGQGFREFVVMVVSSWR